MSTDKFHEAIKDYLGKEWVDLNESPELALDHLGESESISELARWFYDRGRIIAAEEIFANDYS